MKNNCFCGETANKNNQVVCEDFNGTFCDNHFEEWKKEREFSVRSDMSIAIAILLLAGLVLGAAKLLYLSFVWLLN